jgi:Smg protein
MKENMLEVLMYLFENYMIEGSEFEPDHEVLSVELSQAGFGDNEINKAFDWLEDLSVLCEEADNPPSGGSELGVRYFSPEEETRFTKEEQGLLLSLQQNGILDAQTRELIIDRIMALETDEIDLDHLKWVIMMILCNQPGREDLFIWAEELVLDGVQAHLH